jgi:hypothetical protein
MGKGALERMCDACAAKACGSCSRGVCECFAIFKAWEDYKILAATPPGRIVRRRPPVQAPEHHAYTGRHERNVAYAIDARGRRVKQR